MRILDPGHVYGLIRLDGEGEEILKFVKREGPGYPGNIGHHPGTNMQDVMRAITHRLSYLDTQISDSRNELIAGHIGMAIYLLEERAADRHHRPHPTRLQAIFDEICIKCGHVGCNGECHP